MRRETSFKRPGSRRSSSWPGAPTGRGRRDGRGAVPERHRAQCAGRAGGVSLVDAGVPLAGPAGVPCAGDLLCRRERLGQVDAAGGLAAVMLSVVAGGADMVRDESLAIARQFAASYRFSRRHKPRAKLFVRSEDLFGFVRRVGRTMAEMRELEQHFEATVKGDYAPPSSPVEASPAASAARSPTATAKTRTPSRTARPSSTCWKSAWSPRASTSSTNPRRRSRRCGC